MIAALALRHNYFKIAYLEWARGARASDGRFSAQKIYNKYKISSKSVPLSRDDLAAVREADKKAAKSPRASNERAFLRAMAGQPSASLKILKTAILETPLDAELHSDLSATYLARFDLENRASDIILALSASDRALKIDPFLEMAYFNRSVALERLFMRSAAVAAWSAYLNLDGSSRWANEARERRQNQSSDIGKLWSEAKRQLASAVRQNDRISIERIVSEFTQFSREHGEYLLGQWANALLRGQVSEAKSLFRHIEEIGHALAKCNGDLMLLHAVETIKSSDSSDHVKLAQGHRDLALGRRLYDEFDIDTANLLMVRAQKNLLDTGSPFVGWAAFFLSACAYQVGEYDRAFRDLESLLGTLTPRSYPSLEAKILWLMGLIEYVRANPTLALQHYSQALTVFHQIGEKSNEGAIYGFISEVYHLLGNLGEALKNLHEALKLRFYMVDSKRIYAVYQQGAFLCADYGEPQIGIEFQSEAVKVAAASLSPELLSIALSVRAKLHQEVENTIESGHDVRRARNLASGVEDLGVRQVILGDLDLTDGELRARTNPKIALGILEEALANYKEQGYNRYLPRLYLARARARFAAGQTLQGAEELRLGIREVEWQRARIKNYELRSSFLNTVSHLYDEAIEFEFSAKSSADSLFALSEASKSRTLSDLISDRMPDRGGEGGYASSGSFSLSEVQKVVPENTVILEYALLKRKMLLWVIGKDSSVLLSTNLRASEVGSLVSKLRTSIARGEYDMASAKELYRLLIFPAEPFIQERGDHLVIVPDKILHGIPFSALVSPSTTQFLIQSYAVTVSPSATIYVKSVTRSRELAGKVRRALIVGDPLVERKTHPDLASLPGAEIEAREVALMYGKNAQILTRDKATRKEVMGHINDVDVFHFAGHALVNPTEPMLSSIVLAPDQRQRDSGVLFAFDLYRYRFKRIRLAVLSACYTGAGRNLGLEGMESLARPFLAAGVPAVVVSLWAVGDRASAKFFTVFHRETLLGKEPHEAMRSAQVHLLRGEGPFNSPKAWAAFEIIGGTSSAQLK